MKSRLLLLAVICCFGYLGLQAQSNCDDNPGISEVTGPAAGTAVDVDTPTSYTADGTCTLPTTEFVITNPAIIADDLSDTDDDPATAPESLMLGPAILGASTTGSITPADFGFAVGDQICITPVCYAQPNVQSMVDSIFNGQFFGATCCAIVETIITDFCPNLSSCPGEDPPCPPVIDDLNAVLALLAQFGEDPDATVSVPGFIGSVDGVNDSASALPAECGGLVLPICYAVGAQVCYTVEDLTNTEEIAFETLTIQPNPVVDEMRINFSSTLSNNAEVTIMNTLGAIVFEGKIDANATSWSYNAGELSNGVYLVTITDGNKLMSGKFLH